MDEELALRTIRLEGAYTSSTVAIRVLTATRPARRERVGSLALSDGVVLMTGAHGTLVLDRVAAGGLEAMTALAWWSGARLEATSSTWS